MTFKLLFITYYTTSAAAYFIGNSILFSGLSAFMTLLMMYWYFSSGRFLFYHTFPKNCLLIVLSAMCTVSS